MKMKTQVKAGLLDGLAVTVIGQSSTLAGSNTNNGNIGLINVSV